jgi:hypothetical protein
VPLAQVVVPSLQGFPVSQETLGVQGEQLPLLQYRFVPQPVPLATFIPPSIHSGTPLVQESVPVWHLLLGVQGAPAMQLMQMPLLQTRLVPQVLPSAAGPVSTHTEAPLLQSVLPTLQGSARSQVAPAAQSAH